MVGEFTGNQNWFTVQGDSVCDSVLLIIRSVSMVKIAYDTLSMFTDLIAHKQKCSAPQTKSFIFLCSSPFILVVLCCTLYHFNVVDIQYTKHCWLSGKHVFTIVYVPISLAMTFNILCFTRSILKMRKLEKVVKSYGLRKRRKR